MFKRIVLVAGIYDSSRYNSRMVCRRFSFFFLLLFLHSSKGNKQNDTNNYVVVRIRTLLLRFGFTECDWPNPLRPIGLGSRCQHASGVATLDVRSLTPHPNRAGTCVSATAAYHDHHRVQLILMLLLSLPRYYNCCRCWQRHSLQHLVHDAFQFNGRAAWRKRNTVIFENAMWGRILWVLW